MPMSSVRGIIEAEQEFLDFFAMVQEEASKLGRVFFIQDQEGHDHVLPGLYLAEMDGWLVPEDRADEFEAIWLEESGHPRSEEWDEFYVCEDFTVADDGKIRIFFDDLDEL